MNANEAQEIVARARTAARLTSHPFPIAEVDDFLPRPLLRQVQCAFPSPTDPAWETSHIGEVERKRRSTWGSIFDVPPYIKDVVELLNSSLFLHLLSDILHIPKLLPDPYFTGGGLNESFQGDYLDVHVDGNYHDASGLNRRVNAILYLNDEWKSEWGGCLGLYTNEGVTLVRSVEPIANKLILFDTSDVSFHGYPDPIACPPDVSRRSIILYYYTKESTPARNVRVAQPHSALWVKRELKDKNHKTTREFS